MRTIPGGNFSHSYHEPEKYGVPMEDGLLVIDKDTLFVGSNFCQKLPHTPLFSVRNGARLVLRDVNAVNVTLPDEMAPGDFTGNNAQIETIPTGNPDRPTVNLLHECEKCATFVKALREDIASGAWKAGATIIDAKASARLLREEPAVASVALEDLKAENWEACLKWIPQLSEPDAVAPEVEGTPEQLGFWATLWTKAKALVGVK